MHVRCALRTPRVDLQREHVVIDRGEQAAQRAAQPARERGDRDPGVVAFGNNRRCQQLLDLRTHDGAHRCEQARFRNRLAEHARPIIEA
jgi:hypothetical protein